MIEEKDLKGDGLLRMTEKLLNDKVFTRKLKSNLKEFEVKESATKIYNEIVSLLGDKDERSN